MVFCMRLSPGTCGQKGKGAVRKTPGLLRTDPAAGFSLLEILVVVMIITILATFVGVSVVKQPGRAKVAAAKSQMSTLRMALQLYRMDTGQVPTQEQGLLALVEKPTVMPIPSGYRSEGYLDRRKLPADPWGNRYVYLAPGSDGSAFEIITYGADGEPGGNGEAADISTADL